MIHPFPQKVDGKISTNQEYWKNEIVEYWGKKTMPPAHYSIIPLFHCSVLISLAMQN
jgi:hypothetical protein